FQSSSSDYRGCYAAACKPGYNWIKLQEYANEAPNQLLFIIQSSFFNKIQSPQGFASARILHYTLHQ
ncbi:MAG: hypothetical protein ACE3JR_08050, partial [Ectobacillus sp.]